MTELMRKAMETAAKLSEAEQDRFAQWLIEEIEEEAKWDASFARSQDQLAKMAQEALAEHRAGKSEPLDPDKI